MRYYTPTYQMALLLAAEDSKAEAVYGFDPDGLEADSVYLGAEAVDPNPEASEVESRSGETGLAFPLEGLTVEQVSAQRTMSESGKKLTELKWQLEEFQQGNSLELNSQIQSIKIELEAKIRQILDRREQLTQEIGVALAQYNQLLNRNSSQEEFVADIKQRYVQNPDGAGNASRFDFINNYEMISQEIANQLSAEQANLAEVDGKLRNELYSQEMNKLHNQITQILADYEGSKDQQRDASIQLEQKLQAQVQAGVSLVEILDSDSLREIIEVDGLEAIDSIIKAVRQEFEELQVEQAIQQAKKEILASIQDGLLYNLGHGPAYAEVCDYIREQLGKLADNNPEAQQLLALEDSILVPKLADSYDKEIEALVFWYGQEETVQDNLLSIPKIRDYINRAVSVPKVRQSILAKTESEFENSIQPAIEIAKKEYVEAKLLNLDQQRNQILYSQDYSTLAGQFEASQTILAQKDKVLEIQAQLARLQSAENIQFKPRVKCFAIIESLVDAKQMQELNQQKTDLENNPAYLSQEKIQHLEAEIAKLTAQTGLDLLGNRKKQREQLSVKLEQAKQIQNSYLELEQRKQDLLSQAKQEAETMTELNQVYKTLPQVIQSELEFSPSALSVEEVNQLIGDMLNQAEQKQAHPVEQLEDFNRQLADLEAQTQQLTKYS